MSTTVAKSLDLDRLPPHDHTAEKAVIAACLRDPDVIPAVREIVGVESFYFDANQQVVGRHVCTLPRSPNANPDARPMRVPCMT